MSTPSSFEIGRAIGGNISGGIRQAREKSAIDEILEQANASGSQDSIDDAMRSILSRVSPERQPQAVALLQQKQNKLMQEKKRQAYIAQGLDPSIADLDPGVQKEFIKKREEKVGGANAALQTLGRMREIQSTGHLGGKVNIIGTGRKAFSTFSSEGQRLRSEYERLGKSLIQSSTNIPIRNRQEFETLAHDLYDVTKSNEEILGTLDAMERIIRQSVGQIEGSAQNNQIHQPNSGSNPQFVQMRDPSGVIRNIPANQVQAAQQAGGVLVK